MMAKFVVPVTYAYEAQFLIEADSAEEAGAILLSTPKWQPKPLCGLELHAVDNWGREWSNVTLHVDAIQMIGVKAQATTTKPKARRRAK